MQDNPINDHIIEQVMPTSTYGTSFFVVTFPEQQIPRIYLRIICRDASTTVSINSNPVFSCSAGDIVDNVQTASFVQARMKNVEILNNSFLHAIFIETLIILDNIDSLILVID